MNDIALVTSTYYRSADELRFRLALETARMAKNAKIPLYVVDGSPSRDIKDAFEAEGAYVLDKVGITMGAPRRQAIRAALAGGYQYIGWTEPEKTNIVLIVLLGNIQRALYAGANIVVPARISMESYPPYQWHCETVGNRMASRFMGRSDVLDFWFGPKFMDRAGAEMFLGYEGEYGDRWESTTTIPIVRAVAAGLQVVSVPVPFTYPPEQRDAELNDPIVDDKRWVQLRTILEATETECHKLGLLKH